VNRELEARLEQATQDLRSLSEEDLGMTFVSANESASLTSGTDLTIGNLLAICDEIAAALETPGVDGAALAALVIVLAPAPDLDGLFNHEDVNAIIALANRGLITHIS